MPSSRSRHRVLLALALTAGCPGSNDPAQDKQDATLADVDGGAPASSPEAGARRVRDRGECQPGSGVLVRGKLELARSCQGECEFEVSIIYPIMLGQCTIPQVHLTVQHRPAAARTEASGRLSLDGWQRAVDLGLALQAEELEPAYGDPYRDGSGVVTLMFEQPRVGLIDTSYVEGSPPTVLAEADAFIQSLVEQLRRCQGPDIVDCQQ